MSSLSSSLHQVWVVTSAVLFGVYRSVYLDNVAKASLKLLRLSQCERAPWTGYVQTPMSMSAAGTRAEAGAKPPGACSSLHVLGQFNSRRIESDETCAWASAGVHSGAHAGSRIPAVLRPAVRRLLLFCSATPHFLVCGPAASLGTACHRDEARYQSVKAPHRSHHDLNQTRVQLAGPTRPRMACSCDAMPARLSHIPTWAGWWALSHSASMRIYSSTWPTIPNICEVMSQAAPLS